MKLTVLGPGCWGLTLAWLMNDNFEDIVIWGRECDLNDDLVINKHCSKPLEVQLDKKVQITSDLKKSNRRRRYNFVSSSNRRSASGL